MNVSFIFHRGLANCLLFAVFVGMSVALPICLTGCKSEVSPFDSQGWAKADDRTYEGRLVREAIAKDAVSSGSLVGLSKDEVLKLLGRISDKVVRDQEFPPNECWYYVVGDKACILSIDYQWLELRFRNGIVYQTDVVRVYSDEPALFH